MNNSWNPYDNGVSAQGLSPLIQNALKTGATIVSFSMNIN